jgi:hypothetical protein
MGNLLPEFLGRGKLGGATPSRYACSGGQAYHNQDRKELERVKISAGAEISKG